MSFSAWNCYLYYWFVCCIYATYHPHVPVTLMKMYWEYVACSGCVVRRCSCVCTYQFFSRMLLVAFLSPSLPYITLRKFHTCSLQGVHVCFANSISDSLIMWVMDMWVNCNRLLVAVCSLLCCSCVAFTSVTGYWYNCMEHVIVMWYIRCSVYVCVRALSVVTTSADELNLHVDMWARPL